MSRTSDVFQLVKSMNKQEKRYFRLYATSHIRTRENNNTRLFDAIDRSESDDDALILAHFGDPTFAPKLPSAKNKLGSLLLRSLVAYNAGKSQSLELHELMAEIEILYRKGLYGHCRRLISRTEKKARQLEKFPILIELFEWRRRLLLKELGDSLDTDLHELYREINAILNDLEGSSHFLETQDRMFSLGHRRPHLRNPRDRSALEEFMNSKAKATVDTLTAKIAHMHTRGIVQLTLGNYTKARVAYGEAITLWEANPHFIQEYTVEYKKELCDYLTCCIALREFEAFRATLDKIKALPPDSTDAEIHLFESVYYLEIVYCLNSGQLAQGLAAAEAISIGIKRYEQRLRPHRLITLLFNCSIVYFLSGRFEQSLHCINEIQNQDHGEAKRDGQDFIKLFRLIILFELDAHDILDNVFRSTYRYVSKHDTVLPFERVILHTIRRLHNSVDSSESRSIYENCRRELLDIFHGTEHKLPVGLMELLFWVESKLSSRSIRDIYIAKMQQAGAKKKEDLFPTE